MLSFIIQSYRFIQEQVEASVIGETEQLWMIYMNLMHMQALAYAAVQKINFDLLFVHESHSY